MKYIELAFVVVCVVAVVHALATRAHLTTPLVLVLSGVLLSWFAHLDSLQEQAPLIFVILVPPLIYIEAWLCPKRELWKAIGPVLGLAVGLVAATIMVVAYGSHSFLPVLGWGAAIALASALAPTDTVAVAALSKGQLMDARLKTILGGEGLFNDAVALVAFEFAVQAVASPYANLQAITSDLDLVIGGGALVGTGVALLGFLLRHNLVSAGDDHASVDVILSLMTPYAAYLAAEKCNVSGGLAVVVAGLLAGVLDKRHLTPRLRLQGKSIWTTVQLALNGAVFVLLGLEVRQVLERLLGLSVFQLFLYSLLLTTTLIAIRALWLIMAVCMFRMKLHSKPATAQPHENFRSIALASLCGVRGTLTLTAALSIPLTSAAGTVFPGRDLIVVLAAGTVLMTLGLHAVVCFFMRADQVEAAPAAMYRARMALARIEVSSQRAELERLARSAAIDEDMRLAFEEELDLCEMVSGLQRTTVASVAHVIQ